MGDRKIRHIGDVFGAGDRENRKPENILERKTSFNVFKNKQAPQPPKGANMLPKIGNYQPKSLLEFKRQNNLDGMSPKVDLSDNSKDRQDSVASHGSNHHSAAPKAMVIGDKDELLKIENDHEDMQDEHPVPAPRRKRQAPQKPDEMYSEVKEQTGNPVFGRSVSHRSDEEPLDLNFEEQGGDIDFSSGIDNPAFNSRSRQESTSSHRDSFDHSNERDISRDHSRDIETRRNSESKSRSQSDSTAYPYIPPPDYEDEEVTMDFTEETEAFMHDTRVPHLRQNRPRPHTMYQDRELEGEDFGKYLDDDYEFDPPFRRPGPPPMGKTRQAPRPPPPNNKQKYQKHPDKKAAKNKKKHDKYDPKKRNTIRDFTFSDSKIGWGDRTVKSTSAKGRYIKREKDRKRIDKNDQFIQNGNGPGSYEDFLRAKNGIPTESPNSSDSGVELGDDRQNMDMYINSQPKQFRHGDYDRKPSVWKRLTWRFRKSVTVTRQEDYEYNTKL